MFTSPYRNTVSLPGKLFKSYDDGTPAYGKMANSYFFTVMYMFMCMLAQHIFVFYRNNVSMSGAFLIMLCDKADNYSNFMEVSL